MARKITTSFSLGGVDIDVTTEDELSQAHDRTVLLTLHVDKKPLRIGFTQDSADILIAALQTGRRKRSK